MSFILKNSEYTGDLTFQEFPFLLSDFQKWAIDSWKNNKNVLITAHTGSGKTLPAEYAIDYILKNNLGKVLYLTPIKSLSNDKYFSFIDKFPKDKIGIITGDIKFNPEAEILIMTTEILRNLLYNNKIEDIINKVTINIDINEVHTVVFDEVHYINDKERGTVWEECFILLPSKINLINLSATIDNPEHLCNWLANIKKKDIILTTTEKRIVPLRYTIFIDYLPSFLKKKEGIKSNEYNNKLFTIHDVTKTFNSEQYTKIYNHLQNTFSGLSKNQVVNNLVEYLDINGLNPVIFFCFSRQGCEKLANSIHHTLLKENEGSLIDKVVDTYLKKTDNYENYINMSQYICLKKCLDKGVAFHHSGLIPVFKELVEILFSYKNKDNILQPLVKTLFATETFSVGINKPTKTVVFTSLDKFTDNQKRYLKSHEFLQMAGRAGRRGIDTSGLVILLPNLGKLPNVNNMKSIIMGKSQILISKFKPNYKIILKSICNKSNYYDLINNSLINKELQSQIKQNLNKIDNINVPNINLEEISEYKKIIDKDFGFFKPSKKTLKEYSQKKKKYELDIDFMNSYRVFQENQEIIYEKKNLLDQISNDQQILKYQINCILDILLEKGYIINTDANYSLTVKGIVANEISECNELILSELVTNNYLDSLNYKQIGSILSIFGDSKFINNNKEDIIINKEQYSFTYITSILEYINQVSKDYEKLEIYKKLYINTVWSFSTDLIEATYLWLNGESFNKILNTFPLYEGNLIKDFIKIYNLSANLVNVSRILNKSNLEIELLKLMDNIMREAVSVESLYVN